MSFCDQRFSHIFTSMFSVSEKIDQYFAVLTTCGAVGVCEFKQSKHKTKNVIVS